MMSPEAELPRKALVSRVLSARPKLVVLEAPAGYGKSTLARLLTAPNSVTCDALGAVTLLEYHRRLLTAIADGCLERGGAMMREASELAEDVAGWRRLIVSAWRERCKPVWFVLENAEQIASFLEAQRTLAGLFECPHPDRRVVICTRKALDLGFGRFSFPHETIRLGTTDLRFSPDEVRALFDGALAADDAVGVEHLAAGWPMAVLMLRRLLAEGRRIEEFDVRRDLGLFEYLTDQVLAALSPRAWRPLLIAAAVDNATVADVEVAYDEDETIADLALLRREAPFVDIVDGALVPHPLVRALLRARHPRDLADAARHVAEAHERAGRRIRAAQLWLAAGETRDAARVISGLERPAWLGSPSFDLASILAQLDRDTLIAYPALWAHSGVSRMSTISSRDLMHEGLEIWNRGDSLTPEVTVSVGIFLCNTYFNLGMLDATETLLNEVCERIGKELAQSSLPIAVWRLGLDAARGRPVNAIPVEAALGMVPENDGYRAVVLYEIIARGFRLRGEREAERSASAGALDVALASRLPHVIGLCAIDAAFGAWLAGEDALFSDFLALLEEHVTASTVMTTRHFLACARGLGKAAEPGFEKVWFRAYGWLVALGSAQRSERPWFAQLALEAADASQQPFIKTVARVALALVDRPNAKALLREALRLASSVDGTALRDAVQSLLAGGDGSMLAPLASRLGGTRRGRSLEVIRGTCSVDASQVDISDRSLEILVLLACRRRTLKRHEIAECLWPDAEPEQTRGALRTAISRLRTIPGMRDAVLSSPAGYTLASDMRVDLDIIRQALISSQTRGGPSPATLQILEPAFEALLARDVTRAARWEWFAQTERDLEETLRGIAAQLGRAALAQGDTQRALEIARLLAVRDPADEEACELAMRSLLAAGDAAAARRELQHYEAHAATDLGIAVLSPLRQLLPRSTT